MVQRVRNLEVESRTMRTMRRRLMRTMRRTRMRTTRRPRLKMRMSNDPICGEESADSGQLERGDRMSGGKVRMGSDQEEFYFLTSSSSSSS